MSLNQLKAENQEKPVELLNCAPTFSFFAKLHNLIFTGHSIAIMV